MQLHTHLLHNFNCRGINLRNACVSLVSACLASMISQKGNSTTIMLGEFISNCMHTSYTSSIVGEVIVLVDVSIFFSARGGGRGSSRRQEEGGDWFCIESPRKGWGFQEGEGPRGWEGVCGELLSFFFLRGGGVLNIFIRAETSTKLCIHSRSHGDFRLECARLISETFRTPTLSIFPKVLPYK